MLVGTAGHLHPGGLWTDLKLTRDGRTVRLFRSKAKYFEPAGRGLVGRRDDRDAAGLARAGAARATSCQRQRHLRHAARLLVRVDGDHARRRSTPAGRPARTRSPPTSTCPARSRTGTCPRTDNHGGGRFAGLPDARDLLAAPLAHGNGHRRSRASSTGRATSARRAARGARRSCGAGAALTLRQPRRAADDLPHDHRAARRPATGATGIAYPLANGPVDFDSGKLGFGPQGCTAAANRVTWRHAEEPRPGTYTYFCRVHPFMRGAFQVKPKA